jgi:hypothetical protein
MPDKIPSVVTAIVSDLHLGAFSEADVARAPEVRERLLEALSGADRVVLLGDLLELRERALPDLLGLVRPFFEAMGHATGGRRVVLVPGNHDHPLAEPWLVRRRLDAGDLAPQSVWPVEHDDGVAGRIAAWMPDTEVSLAYPGVWLRPDVYAIHGHYLDLHLTVPRLESIAAAVMGRITGLGRDCRSAADYEAVLAPIYTLHFSLAQSMSPDVLRRSGTFSRSVWNRANGGAAGRGLARFLLGRVTIPGAVAALNRAGLGPFHPDISGEELRRSGLRAMARVVEGLGVNAEHVIFGHTHRAGPLPADVSADWTLPGGTRLWNSGSWYYERAFLGEDPLHSPYWPGNVVRLGDDGPPVIENVLHDAALPVPAL